jgi:ankyrin repeat protein
LSIPFVESGQKAVVELLLRKNKAGVNLKDMDGRTLVLWEASRGHLVMVEWLLQEKVEINIAAKQWRH